MTSEPKPKVPTPDEIVASVVQAVAELPDRTSPEDWPEAMLVTVEELRAIVLAAVDQQEIEHENVKRNYIKLMEQVEAQAATIRTQEAAFKAGYHCHWDKILHRYTFDPAFVPGDSDGAYQVWLAASADAQKD